MLSGINKKNLASRSRSVRSEFRKQRLIESTIECIDKLGLSQTTLARIATGAGVSQGIVIFHFQNKETLLEQVLAFMSREYIDCWQAALTGAGLEPIDQLCALARAPFTASICNRKKISVWYAFWGETRSRPKYHELCGAHDLAYSSRMLSLCQHLEAAGKSSLGAQTAALSIEGMIDGLWQNFLIGPPGFKRQQALSAVFELIEIIFPAERQHINAWAAAQE